MSVRKAIIFSFTSKYLVLLMQLGSTMVLSRILTPEDIGIYSIAYAMIVFGHVFRDFGITNYVSQEKNLTTDRLRSAMTLTFSFAWFISAVLFLSADSVAEFYQEEGVKSVFHVLALNFIIIPFGSVTRAYIAREMRFKFLMVMEVCCTLINLSVVLVLAFMGFRYMSMAWASVASVAAEIIILQVFRPRQLPYLPGIKSMKEVVSFGSLSFAEAALTEFGKFLPELIVGKVWGMHSVGILSRAQGTLQLFERAVTNGISPILLPYFSKENREGQDIKYPFLYTTSCMLGLAWPFFAFVAIMAESIVLVLYGDQWGEAVVLVQVLCFRGAVEKLMIFVHPSLMSLGLVHVLLRIQMLFIPLQLVLILAVMNYGLTYIVAVLAIEPLLRFLYVFFLLRGSLNVQVLDFAQIILKSLIPTVVCSAALFLALDKFQFEHIEGLVVAVFIFGLFFLFSIFLVKHELSREILKVYKTVLG